MRCAGNDAGMAFEKAASCHLKCDSPHEAATAYTEAANCYKKTDAKGTRPWPRPARVSADCYHQHVR